MIYSNTLAGTKQMFYTRPYNLTGYQHCLPLTCPLILSVFNIILSIPATSDDYERGFSTMRQVKTDWRSKLHIITLNDCMRIFWRVLPLQTLILPMLYTTDTVQELERDVLITQQ